jgi:hypothetical protein
MTPLVIILIGVGIFVILGAHYQLERLVRAEHDLHYDSWVADGRPQFMTTRERFGLGSHWARSRVSFVWLFRTPSWVTASSDHVRHLRLLRLFVAAWNLPILSFIVFAIYGAPRH